MPEIPFISYAYRLFSAIFCALISLAGNNLSSIPSEIGLLTNVFLLDLSKFLNCIFW